MYLFDIDGTLLLTGGAGSRAINFLFEKHYGVQAAMDAISAGGKTDGMIFQECAQAKLQRDLAEEELLDLLNEYIPLLRQGMRDGENFRLMPHVHECMAFVAEHQELVGIATGNVEEAAIAKLERAELREHFHFGGYGSDSSHRPELVAKAIERGMGLSRGELRPRDFVVVGDTLHDISAAKACGARVLAVATGSASKEVLLAADPDAVFSTLEELPSWHNAHFALG